MNVTLAKRKIKSREVEATRVAVFACSLDESVSGAHVLDKWLGNFRLQVDNVCYEIEASDT